MFFIAAEKVKRIMDTSQFKRSIKYNLQTNIEPTRKYVGTYNHNWCKQGSE